MKERERENKRDRGREGVREERREKKRGGDREKERERERERENFSIFNCHLRASTYKHVCVHTYIQYISKLNNNLYVGTSMYMYNVA